MAKTGQAHFSLRELNHGNPLSLQAMQGRVPARRAGGMPLPEVRQHECPRDPAILLKMLDVLCVGHASFDIANNILLS